ncbi:molybdenum cofactor guanylyltransferase [Aliiglaciecola sp. 3_MG-2023]|uniref:molybdenum cofactor guanylyltransferase n=1 Tax=Aliiglaciecola sp. 3_MG-2023 TaxID=3062644 RepID=UPI0026E18B8B|nr:molybdenum cofactor guanylyltransferase [Aliiglaciecola sp. 3_MG-2023]MDO6693690.1 molybdenum cofactor guanylyltransferase [Aliiglaciecola sp. 3_MG-2023]
MNAEHSSLNSTLGLILAGGQSSRMGVDKATLSLHGESFLQLAIRRFESIGIHNYIVSSNTLKGAMPDRKTGIGPLAALDAVLSLPKHRLNGADSVLVVPIDMPLFPADCLKSLVLKGKEQQAGGFYRSQPMPFMVQLTEQFAAILNQQIQSNDRSIFALLNKLNAVEVEYDDGQIAKDAFYNVNTPEQMLKMENISQC